LSLSDVQLAGGSPVLKAQTAAKSFFVTVAQLASPLTVGVKAAAWSVMQVEYSATVAVQVEGMSLQLGLPGLACRQAVSWPVQFPCNIESVGALLDIAYASPFHLHVVSRLMACPK
jgi:hypothetical protein